MLAFPEANVFVGWNASDPRASELLELSTAARNDAKNLSRTAASSGSDSETGASRSVAETWDSRSQFGNSSSESIFSSLMSSFSFAFAALISSGSFSFS